MKTPTHKSLIRAARSHATACTLTLSVRDKEWRQEWDAAANPFAAVAQHQAPGKRAERMAVITPWLAAQAALSSLSSKPASL